MKPAGEAEAGNAGVQRAEEYPAVTHRDGERAGADREAGSLPVRVQIPTGR